jgi:hypothetical protein
MAYNTPRSLACPSVRKLFGISTSRRGSNFRLRPGSIRKAPRGLSNRRGTAQERANTQRGPEMTVRQGG